MVNLGLALCFSTKQKKSVGMVDWEHRELFSDSTYDHNTHLVEIKVPRTVSSICAKPVPLRVSSPVPVQWYFESASESSCIRPEMNPV